MADVTNVDSEIINNKLLFKFVAKTEKALRNRTPNQKKEAILAAEKEIKSLAPKEKLEALEELTP